jgi:small subunit ribosomal protein S8
MITSLSTDLLIRLKNGYLASRKSILAPNSKFNRSILDILKKHNFVDAYQVSEDKKSLIISLKYQNLIPKISQVTLFSKPGRRFYQKSTSLPWGKTQNSLIIIPTSAGLMSQKEAKVKGLGGEIIAEIF